MNRFRCRARTYTKYNSSILFSFVSWKLFVLLSEKFSVNFEGWMKNFPFNVKLQREAINKFYWSTFLVHFFLFDHRVFIKGEKWKSRNFPSDLWLLRSIYFAKKNGKRKLFFFLSEAFFCCVRSHSPISFNIVFLSTLLY